MRGNVRGSAGGVEPRAAVLLIWSVAVLVVAVVLLVLGLATSSSPVLWLAAALAAASLVLWFLGRRSGRSDRGATAARSRHNHAEDLRAAEGADPADRGGADAEGASASGPAIGLMARRRED